MTAIPVIAGAVTGAVVTPQVPTATDLIAAGPYSTIKLIVRTGGTNTYTFVADDPTSVTPAGATQFNPDMTQVVPISTTKAFDLPAGRFKDANGNINITSASTFTGTTVEAYGY
jgi:hypothetical protein